jgi:predicted component of type VI protein secretion system
MSSPFWQRFPVQPGLHSLEMKDRLQEQVMEDTRGAATVALVAYFREASRRFWREVGCAYPEPVASPMLVRDADQSPSSD